MLAGVRPDVRPCRRTATQPRPSVRRFALPTDQSLDPERLIETIRASVIGDDEAVAGPFGVRRVTYADYTASGRSLSFIEDYIRDAVLPLYANTHTESSGTGLQTTRFREEARRIIRDAVGGTDEHAVIFCGSGSTTAVNRLVDILNLRLPADLDDRYGLRSRIPVAERPVVFIGPYEHHSNELPWRESIADVVTIREDSDGRIDQAQLADELRRYADRPLRIGSFSAASNVTGILSDTYGIARLLHEHGALSFWDVAAAAPYVNLEMSPTHDPLAYKDAVFISPHKFIGGPGTPGVLVARRELFRNRVPSVPGGGTVAYVNPLEHVYLGDPEHREEGGTPAIVESIRAGLVFGLKEAVGVEAIREREESFIRRAIDRWAAVPGLEILGSHDLPRLSIVSFVIRHDGPYLHHNYVVALLNDLFGIQARGGCSCAGPYGHRLLGIDVETSHEFEREISRGCEGIKPGWVRVNFNYFIGEEVFEYILEAVELVARDGWRLLPHYRFDAASGLWQHHAGPVEPPLSLHDVSYADGAMRYTAHRHREPASRLPAYLAEARRLLASPPPTPEPAGSLDVGPDFEHLRWFWLPDELAAELARETAPTSDPSIELVEARPGAVAGARNRTEGDQA
jgi:selenocysteine lyase/cysteine desulfurase